MNRVYGIRPNGLPEPLATIAPVTSAVTVDLSGSVHPSGRITPKAVQDAALFILSDLRKGQRVRLDIGQARHRCVELVRVFGSQPEIELEITGCYPATVADISSAISEARKAVSASW